MNRARIHPTAGEGDEKQQLAVKYAKLPDPDGFADDFLFGYLLAVKDKELARIRKEKGSKYPLKRDSILRMNLAKGLEPYRHVTVFTQSPKFAEGNAWKVGGEGGTSSALLHRETADTAFQYPFALNGEDCRCTSEKCDHKEPVRNDSGSKELEQLNTLRVSCKQRWVGKLLQAIAELANVSGNHARSLFFMAPASIVVRLSERLCPNYDQYHFTVRRDPATNERIYESKVVKMLIADNQGPPLKGLYMGGEIVDTLSKEARKTLERKGVELDPDPSALLDAVAKKLFQPEP